MGGLNKLNVVIKFAEYRPKQLNQNQNETTSTGSFCSAGRTCTCTASVLLRLIAFYLMSGFVTPDYSFLRSHCSATALIYGCFSPANYTKSKAVISLNSSFNQP